MKLDGIKAVLFDLDGTLTNPRLGIGNSIKYALTQMHIDGYSDEILELTYIHVILRSNTP